jgi:DNA mismatch endonuclease (patch repair protein)
MDTLTPAERSARMARVKGKGSSAEMTVRRLVHRMGDRYRLHGAKLPGRPDLVFPGRKKVIFVHGCFLASPPRSRLQAGAHAQDPPGVLGAQAGSQSPSAISAQLEALRALGWEALTLWECELKSNRDLEERIIRFLES